MTALKKCCTFFFLHLNRSSMEILQRMGVEEMFSVSKSGREVERQLQLHFLHVLDVEMKLVWMEFFTTLFQLSQSQRSYTL